MPLRSQIPGPIVQYSTGSGTRAYAIFSYEKGAHAVPIHSILLTTKISRSALTVSKLESSSGTVSVSMSPEGASHAFTVVALGGWTGGIPFAVNHILALIGAVVAFLPFGVGLLRRHFKPKNAQQGV